MGRAFFSSADFLGGRGMADDGKVGGCSSGGVRLEFLGALRCGAPLVASCFFVL